MLNTLTEHIPASPPEKLLDWPMVDLPQGIYTLDLETYCLNAQTDYWVVFCAVLYSWETSDYYLWVADYPTQSFIELPIEPGSILVGSNITGYDRRFIKNEYSLGTPYRYVDTQSMAQRLWGLSNQQRGVYGLYQKRGRGPAWTIGTKGYLWPISVLPCWA